MRYKTEIKPRAIKDMKNTDKYNDEFRVLEEIMQDYEDLRDLRKAKEAAKGKKGVPFEQAISELDL